MQRLLCIAAVASIAVARPELYREKEDFQFSRSSTDEGSKTGYYGAQRGNMGGNYEKAHNMDSLAQNQMSGLVRQVEGELGDASNTKTGNVYTASNSRGIYGSGKYDLSNLQGRNFQEGYTHEDANSLSSQNSRSISSALRNSGFSENQSYNSRYAGHGATKGSIQELETANHQALDAIQNSGTYDSRSQASGYSSQSGYHSQRRYDNSNSNLNSYGSNVRTRVISGTPVRVVIRPGSVVTVPVAAQTYDSTHSATAVDQNAINSEAEVLSSADQHNIYRPSNNAKQYESSYSYRKQWEKHDSTPQIAQVAVPTASVLSENSELYDENRAIHTTANRLDSQNLHASDVYNTKSSSSQSKYESGYNAHQASHGANTHAYTHGAYNSGSAGNTANLVSSDAKPKSYQSSYSYHKSWERQGDPYVIKPVGDVYDDQMSQRLIANQQRRFSSLNSGSHQSYLQDCDCDEYGNVRVPRSIQDDLGQQQETHWQNLEDLGQQNEENSWDDSVGQQVQNNNWNYGRQNLEDLSQHTQDAWDGEGQQTQSSWDFRGEHLGQQSQNAWAGDGQQIQTSWDIRGHKRLGKLENFGHHPTVQNTNDHSDVQQQQQIYSKPAKFELEQSNKKKQCETDDDNQSSRNLELCPKTLNEKDYNNDQSIQQEFGQTETKLIFDKKPSQDTEYHKFISSAQKPVEDKDKKNSLVQGNPIFISDVSVKKLEDNARGTSSLQNLWNKLNNFEQISSMTLNGNQEDRENTEGSNFNDKSQPITHKPAQRYEPHSLISNQHSPRDLGRGDIGPEDVSDEPYSLTTTSENNVETDTNNKIQQMDQQNEKGENVYQETETAWEQNMEIVKQDTESLFHNSETGWNQNKDTSENLDQQIQTTWNQNSTILGQQTENWGQENHHNKTHARPKDINGFEEVYVKNSTTPEKTESNVEQNVYHNSQPSTHIVNNLEKPNYNIGTQEQTTWYQNMEKIEHPNVTKTQQTETIWGQKKNKELESESSNLDQQIQKTWDQNSDSSYQEIEDYRKQIRLVTKDIKEHLETTNDNINRQNHTNWKQNSEQHTDNYIDPESETDWNQNKERHSDNLDQQSQSTWDQNAENFGQEIDNWGQQSENIWNQNIDKQSDDLEQQISNTWDLNSEKIQQQVVSLDQPKEIISEQNKDQLAQSDNLRQSQTIWEQTKDSLNDNLEQQSQTSWGQNTETLRQLEDAGQQSEIFWKETNLVQTEILHQEIQQASVGDIMHTTSDQHGEKILNSSRSYPTLVLKQESQSSNLQEQMNLQLNSTNNIEATSTEKPGFWKSVGNKWSSTKETVSSWFGKG